LGSDLNVTYLVLFQFWLEMLYLLHNHVEELDNN
jgi:hypothetical protein